MLLGFLSEVGLSFIPLFVAIDALGTVPMIFPLIKDMDPKEKSATTNYAMLTALGLGLVFVIVGKAVFLLMGIKVADFLIAGGLILLIFSIKELVAGKMVDVGGGVENHLFGVVPLGTPLTVGPATLTTLLILIDQYTVPAVVTAFVLNLGITWGFYSQAGRITRLLGMGGLGAMSKIAALLLAAIAIKMMRQGVFQIIPGAS